MRLPIFVILLIHLCHLATWAQTKNVERPVRTPQTRLKDDANGATINRYLTPQWQSQVSSLQRSQRAEGGTPQRLRQAQQAPQRAPTIAQRAPTIPQRAPTIPQTHSPQYPQPEYGYRPYSAIPGHIRQLIENTYQPQPPYVDPTSFLYGVSFVAPQQQQQQEQQPAPAASETSYLQPSARYQSIDSRNAQPQLEYIDRRVERQDRLVYKDDYRQQQDQHRVPQVSVPIRTMPEPPLPTIYLDKNMPTEIKQLLQYQAQIPYDVIANRIQYRPKSVFIPKPLSDDVKGPYYYRSKVYYMDEEDNVDGEYPREKPVDEGRRH